VLVIFGLASFCNACKPACPNHVMQYGGDSRVKRETEGDEQQEVQPFMLT
jgi:formate hydrogenlyase subunit 6/NADH:ubiquinone oxidoreductase subunit I